MLTEPPLAVEHPPAQDIKRAQKLNSEGIALKAKHSFPEAIAKFQAALAIDPSSLFARYNLACTYNLAGDRSRAFALLEQFVNTQCTDCRGILAFAATDVDWKDRVADADFNRLTAEPARLAQQLQAAGKELAQVWLACKPDQVAKFVDPNGAPIDITYVNCCCDGPNCGRGERIAPTKLRTLFGHCDTRSHYTSDRIVCTGSCCNYDGDIHDGDANTLLHACFADVNGRPVITDLIIGLGP